MSRPEAGQTNLSASASTVRRMAAINSASAGVCPISLLPTQHHSSGPHIMLSEPVKTGAMGHPSSRRA